MTTGASNRTYRLPVNYGDPDACFHEWMSWEVWPDDLVWHSEICRTCGDTMINGEIL